MMHLTKTLRPPGGATALIAVIGGDAVHNLGFLYAVMPAALGAGVMLIIALIVNNIPNSRRYPEFWLLGGFSISLKPAARPFQGISMGTFFWYAR
jgi:CBS-domain-containing membrane protein